MNITIYLLRTIDILNYKFIFSNNISFYILSDLSDCQLMQVPDAVYYMMRNTTLVSCNLSSNVITKIPPKFPAKFSLITGKKKYFKCSINHNDTSLKYIFMQTNNSNCNAINSSCIDIALEYIYLPYTYFLYCV